MDVVKIFISSVRRGLEQERDALPGLIMALGHEPVNFETFGAQPVPSREACLRGVASSDVYLMLLGPNYGHIFPETGQSATHDEWVAAITKGLPCLVFRKSGVESEPAQEDFARQVGDYGSGAFYAGFESAADLQTRVVEAIRRIEEMPGELTFEQLADVPAINWRDDWSRARHQDGSAVPTLAVHVWQVAANRLSARSMSTVQPRLVASVRRSEVVPQDVGLTPTVDAESVAVSIPAPAARYGTVSVGHPLGVRVQSDLQISAWRSLPRDGLGTILDAADLRSAIAESLRLVGATGLVTVDRLAIAVELTNLSLVSEGTLTGVSRTSGSMGFAPEGPIRITPDETVTRSALAAGSNEVAGVLVDQLLNAFRNRGGR